MKVIIRPSILAGTVTAPPSKSYTHRAIILASLANGISIIRMPLISDDTKATIEACRLLGVNIRLKGTNLEIEGTNGNFPQKNSTTEINCGLSGTTIRLMTGVAAMSPTKVILTGEKRLRERPIGELVKTLKSLGVNITASGNNQFPPVTVKRGNFSGGRRIISGNTSSQFISSLLLIAPFGRKDTMLTVDDLKSAPYVDITIDMMKTFGVEVQKKGNLYKVKAGQKYQAQKYTVEGDYSSASYFFAASAITGSKITVKNLNKHSVQGDKYFLEIIKQMKNDLSNRNINMGNFPDIVPSVAIVAANSYGTTVIENVDHLRLKETDRIAAIACELRKMNVDVRGKKDSLIIQGGKLKGTHINTYNDHRIAMSFAVAGLAADGETIINNAEVVNKSYPDFWKDLKKLGAKIEIIK